MGTFSWDHVTFLLTRLQCWFLKVRFASLLMLHVVSYLHKSRPAVMTSVSLH